MCGYTNLESRSFIASRRWAMAGSAILALLLGTAVYVLDRDWSSTLFMSPWAEWQGSELALFGPLGQFLPSFCHAYAFSLLLIMLLGRTRYARLIGVTAWFAVAAVLETLQALDPALSSPDAAQTGLGAALFNSLQVYVSNGRFDPADLAAAAFGCLVALLVSLVPEETP